MGDVRIWGLEILEGMRPLVRCLVLALGDGTSTSSPSLTVRNFGDFDINSKSLIFRFILSTVVGRLCLFQWEVFRHLQSHFSKMG